MRRASSGRTSRDPHPALTLIFDSSVPGAAATAAAKSARRGPGGDTGPDDGGRIAAQGFRARTARRLFRTACRPHQRRGCAAPRRVRPQSDAGDARASAHSRASAFLGAGSLDARGHRRPPACVRRTAGGGDGCGLAAHQCGARHGAGGPGKRDARFAAQASCAPRPGAPRQRLVRPSGGDSHARRRRAALARRNRAVGRAARVGFGAARSIHADGRIRRGRARRGR